MNSIKDIFNRPIAHRGLHNEKNEENTLEAFLGAKNKNYAIELDVQILKDDTIVVFHDYDLMRLKKDPRKLINLKKDDINKIRLKNEQKIPLFEEVLEAINGAVPLLIEIKAEKRPNKLEKRIIDILKSYKGDFAIQSFNPLSLIQIKEKAPQVLRGQLAYSFCQNKTLPFYKKFILKHMFYNKKVEPHFISYKHTELPSKIVSKYTQKHSTAVFAWTIRTYEEYKKVKPFCDNIIFENFEPII